MTTISTRTFVQLWAAFRSWTARPRVRRLLLVVGLLGTLIGTALAWTALDLTPAGLDLGLLTVLVGLSFLTIPLNAWEFQLAGIVAGTNVEFRVALRITSTASALNLLPLPAGFLYRVNRLRNGTDGFGSALRASVFVAAIWLGLSALVAAAVVLWRTGASAGYLLAAISTGSLGYAGIVLFRMREGRLKLATLATALEIGFILQAWLRLFIAIRILGFDPLPIDVLVLAAGSALASTVGVVPGSLGLWEIITAALATLVSLPGASGFLAAALSRVSTYVALSLFFLCTFLLGLRNSREPR